MAYLVILLAEKSLIFINQEIEKRGKLYVYLQIKRQNSPHNTLQRLYKKLNCSKIIINSGYRCVNHDKTVGGSGSGHHVYGNAADIVCYDQSNNKISSKKVSCIAQDIGFGGIANIDNTYTATHVDVRTSNFWRGDEVKTTAYSVTDDFYKYYGISRTDIQSKKTKNISLTIDDTTYTGVLTEK